MRTLNAPRLLAAAVVACGALLASAALADNFVVNDPGWSVDAIPGNGTCADSLGKCTLNAAIMEGNVRSGTHTITFLPAVTQVTLTGTLNPMRAPFTIIGNLPVRTIINGAGILSCFVLEDSGDMATGHSYDPITGAGGADGSTISNMVIQNCNGHGISANGHGYIFTNNYIGTDVAGVTAVLNKGAGISISASRVYNNQSNMLLQNLFNSFPVQPLDNSQISGFASQLATLYSNALLGPVVISNNLISGNENSGIDVFSENLAGVWIRDNFIGTDFTGNFAVPNGAHGIIFDGPAFGNVIGPGNVISGNTLNGIEMAPGAVSLPNFIMGNRIGLSATLSTANIGNGASGIDASTKPETTLDGRINPSGIALIIGPANVISDNKGAPQSMDPDTLGGDGAGILVTGTSEGIKIRGNTIGLGEFPPGTPVSSLAYGNAGDGIIIAVSDIVIGGTGPSDGNIIAGNGRHGITIKSSGVNGTQVQGNSIGVHPLLAGDLTLGNGSDGIHIDAASTSFIGGAGGTDFNTIAANGRNGVKMRSGGFTNGWGHLLQRNRIYSNAKNGTGIGIDIDHPEELPNDGTDFEIPQNYANLDQSQPVICTGAVGEPATCAGFTAPGDAGGNTSMDFTLVTHGPGSIPATYRIEFFKINAANVNAATSMTYLGEQTVTADINGVLSCPGGRCAASVAAATAGSSVVMTATDVTAITNTLGASGWASTIQCIVFMNCFINNTSEYSNAVQPVAVPVNTTTTVTNVTPGTIVYGQPVTATASVTAASGPAPTGTVTINAGASSCVATLGSVVMQTSSGSCQLAPAPLVAGSPYTVTATYAANASFNGSTGGNGSLTVNKADTATTISSDAPDPSQQGAAIVVAADVVAVAPGAGTPTGTITVTDGVGTCTITLPAANCNLTLSTSGARMIVATYNGDANFNADASPAVSHQVDPVAAAATTTAVTLVAPATSVFGQTVAVTATVTSTTSPTGSVTLNAGASSCIAALAPATATTATGTCNLAPPLPAAAVAYPVTAAYPGGVGFLSSNGGGATATVNKASTTTAISANTPNPSIVNTAVTVTAGVAVVAPGAGTPTGTIVVTSTPGGETCTITLPAVSCNLTPATTGAKTLTAVYSGNADFLTSTSVGVGQTVNGAAAVATTTAVTLVAPAVSVFGQNVTVTVTVTSTGQAGGSVTVNASTSSCTATLAPATATTSTATCNLAPPLAAAAVAYPVTASYAGSAGFL
ncbi:MAG: Ig-like domain-containing protein, partial [Betaproteobacteria bacterium]